MVDTWYRAQRYRDLAEECRRLAADPSTEDRDRYLRMAEHYSTLAQAEAYRRE
jgi:hypothetical protein